MPEPHIHTVPASSGTSAPVLPDLEIICGEDVFEVHKLAVCANSPVLKRICEENWRQQVCLATERGCSPRPLTFARQTDDGYTPVPLRYHERTHDAETVGRMLSFVYMKQYEVDERHPDIEPEQGCERSSVQYIAAHLRCHALAEDYQITAMSDMALAQVKRLLFACDPAVVAETVRIVAANDNDKDSGDAVKLVLREVARERIHELIRDGHLVDVLAKSTSPSAAALSANLLRESVKNHVATVHENDSLQGTISLQEETIQARDLEVARGKAELKRSEAMCAEAMRMLGDSNSRVQELEAELARTRANEHPTCGTDAARHTAGNQILRAALQRAQDDTGRVSLENEALRITADRVQEENGRILQEKRALCTTAERARNDLARSRREYESLLATAQQAHTDLDRALRDKAALQDQLQRAQDEAGTPTKTAGQLKVLHAKLHVLRRKYNEALALADERRKNMEKIFHMVAKLQTCWSCGQEMLMKMQKPLGTPGNVPIADLKLNVRCRDCGYLHEMDQVL